MNKKEPRFSTMDFNPEDHLLDLEKRVDFGEMVCIVDEEAGGIIAYAIGEEHAKMIVQALNNESA
jgi:hypothetical protein